MTFSRSFAKLPARLFCFLSPRWYEKHFAFMMPARNMKLNLRACQKKQVGLVEITRSFDG